jgi:hypothetical protein
MAIKSKGGCHLTVETHAPVERTAHDLEHPPAAEPADTTLANSGDDSEIVASENSRIPLLPVAGLVVHSDDMLEIVRLYVPQAVGIRQLENGAFILELPHSRHGTPGR